MLRKAGGLGKASDQQGRLLDVDPQGIKVVVVVVGCTDLRHGDLGCGLVLLGGDGQVGDCGRQAKNSGDGDGLVGAF